jgi:ATP-binding cassette subfamily B protein/subfamily B ATP-binding cassette protein MsbA
VTAWRRRLARYARPHARGLAVVVLLILLTSALGTLQPWPLKLLVDYVLRQRPLPSSAAWLRRLPGAASAAPLVGWLAGGTALLFLAGRAVEILQRYIQTGIGNA